jgi:hypothetical protein
MLTRGKEKYCKVLWSEVYVQKRGNKKQWEEK